MIQVCNHQVWLEYYCKYMLWYMLWYDSIIMDIAAWVIKLKIFRFARFGAILSRSNILKINSHFNRDWYGWVFTQNNINNAFNHLPQSKYYTLEFWIFFEYQMVTVDHFRLIGCCFMLVQVRVTNSNK